MANDRLVHFKAVLKDPASNMHEARRFEIAASQATSFVHIMERLRCAFFNVQGADFKLTWKDADGDDITISSDEELVTAFNEMNDSKVLYITFVDSKKKKVGENKNQNEEIDDSMCDNVTLEELTKKFMPLLTALGTPGSSPSSSNGVDSSNKPEVPLVDIIQNIAANFLGSCPVNQPTQQQNQKDEAQRAKSTYPTRDLKIAQGLAKLEEMGFSNKDNFLVHLLERYDGDVNKVVTFMSET